MELSFLLEASLRRKASWFHANGVWGGSGGCAGGGQCGAAAVGSETARPAQQVAAHAGKQRAVSGDPAGGSNMERARWMKSGAGSVNAASAAHSASACARKRRIQNWPR